jgi:hypothetical protein
LRDRNLRILFARGADWIIIDQGHGAVGSESLHATIAATAGTRCASFPLVSASKRDEVPVKLAPLEDALVVDLLRPTVDGRTRPVRRSRWGAR